MRRTMTFAGLALFAACGGSTVFVQGQDSGADAAGSTDSGSEGAVTDSGGRDTATARDTAAVDAACLVDADVTNLSLPDAALGDGGGSVGKCTACIKANCGDELQACQDDCDCRESAIAFFGCISSGKTVTSCGGSLVTAGAAAQSVGLCTLNSGCIASCQ